VEQGAQMKKTPETHGIAENAGNETADGALLDRGRFRIEHRKQMRSLSFLARSVSGDPGVPALSRR